MVDTGTLLLVARVTQAPNAKGQVAPMFEKGQARCEGGNGPETLAADAAAFSAWNLDTGRAVGIAHLLPTKPAQHHLPGCEGFAEVPELDSAATPVPPMARNLKTKAGRAASAPRKQTVEPVFGISEIVMGLSPCVTRGLHKVQGERIPGCLKWYLTAMALPSPPSPSGRGRSGARSRRDFYGKACAGAGPAGRHRRGIAASCSRTSYHLHNMRPSSGLGLPMRGPSPLGHSPHGLTDAPVGTLSMRLWQPATKAPTH